MRRKWAAYICWVMSVVCLMGSIAVFILCNTTVSITEFAEQWGWLIAITLLLISLTDILIAAAMCWHLWAVRKHGIQSCVSTSSRSYHITH